MIHRTLHVIYKILHFFIISLDFAYFVQIEVYHPASNCFAKASNLLCLSFPLLYYYYYFWIHFLLFLYIITTTHYLYCIHHININRCRVKWWYLMMHKNRQWVDHPHICKWVHLKNKREEPIKRHQWGIGQRPSEG